MWSEMYVAVVFISIICNKSLYNNRMWILLRNLFQSISLVLIYLPFIFFYKIYSLFICLGFIVPFENFSLIWRRHHYRWIAWNFDVYLPPMTSEQWGYFVVPQLLWHGASVYNGHLLPSVWLWSCHYVFYNCVYDLGLSRQGFEYLTFRLRGERSNLLRLRRGDKIRSKHMYVVWHFCRNFVYINYL